MKDDKVKDLLYEALQTEQGGQQVYQTAISCAENDDLKEEWQKYLKETQEHEQHILKVFEAFDLDPNTKTPGREIVRHHGESLVKAMEMAKKAGDKDAAQIVAAECVVLAETKDHQNWSLLSELADEIKGEKGKALKEAVEEVEDQEDEHLYHTRGWARELWIKSLGMPAVLPPPEEEKKVKTMIGAARAEKSREEML